MTDASSDRRRRGLDRLRAINGTGGEQAVEKLRAISGDFADHVVDFIFGDIYSRPGLDLRSRQIATIAALAALGNCHPQLAVHIRGGLNVGLTQAEIIEILSQMAAYAGFPAAINALGVAASVFAQTEDGARG